MKKIKVIDIFKKSESEKLAREQAQDKFFNQHKAGKAEEDKKDRKEKHPDPEIIYKADHRQTNENGEKAFDNDVDKKARHFSSLTHERHRRKEKVSYRGYAITMIVLAVLGSFGYAAVEIFPKAEINIMTKKANWNYENSITANPKIAEIDVANRQIPSAVFYQPKKNMTNLWPATGKKYVERKASGVITIYNEFSSNPQVLIVGTRFEAPDGKIFKLKNKVTVPGAKIENGKIVANGIDAEVLAEKAGEAYNIDPVSKFTIPGFSGSEKYNKFYGSSKNPMSGGFIGDASYPTDNDIKQAKADAENKIKVAIEGYLYTQLASENFKTIEGTRQFSITKETINADTDASGNFSVYIEAEASVQAFKESHVVELLTQLAQRVIGNDFKLREYSIEYKSGATSDAKTKLVSMPLNFKGDFWKPVDAENFRNNILSKSESDLKAFIFSDSAIEKADISLWPFWVNAVPANSKRVNVVVE